MNNSRKRARTGTAGGSNKRVKRSVRLLQSIVLLQQSSVFSDRQQALSIATDDPRLRERSELLSSLDTRTLRRYSDSLCVDMHSQNTIDKMHAVSGQHDSRCICGTPRSPNDERCNIEVDGKIHRSHVCRSCGRLALGYRRFCVNGPKVRQAIREANRRKLHEDASTGLTSSTSEDMSASSDSLDTFLDQLLHIFEQQSDEPTAKTPTTPFDYGNREAHCRHASLDALSVPSQDSELLAVMLSQK